MWPKMMLVNGMFTIAAAFECIGCKREFQASYFALPKGDYDDYVCFFCRQNHFFQHKSKLKFQITESSYSAKRARLEAPSEQKEKHEI